MKCAHVGCESKALYHPVLLIRGDHRWKVPFKIVIRIGVCDTHANDEVSNFLSDAGWEQIVEAIGSVNPAWPWGKPNRKRTVLDVPVPIDTMDAQFNRKGGDAE